MARVRKVYTRERRRSRVQMEPPSTGGPTSTESIGGLERVSGVLLSKAQVISEIGRAGLLAEVLLWPTIRPLLLLDILEIETVVVERVNNAKGCSCRSLVLVLISHSLLCLPEGEVSTLRGRFRFCLYRKHTAIQISYRSQISLAITGRMGFFRLKIARPFTH